MLNAFHWLCTCTLHSDNEVESNLIWLCVTHLKSFGSLMRTFWEKLSLDYVFTQLVTLILEVFCSQLKLWKRTKTNSCNWATYTLNIMPLLYGIALTATLIHTHTHIFTQCPALYLLNQHTPGTQRHLLESSMKRINS